MRLSICCLWVFLLFGQTEVSAELRIVNGERATLGNWPWMVAIFHSNSTPINAQFCGGSLIHPSWVLTASHCTDNETVKSIKVVLGRHTLSQNKVGQIIGIKKIIKHPGYNSNPTAPKDDIALLQLEKPYTQAAVLQVANRYSDSLKVGAFATVIGWGKTNPTDNNSYAESLRQTNVPIVANAVCNGPLSYRGDVRDTMFCAGFQDGHTDACVGDSGGPLVIQTETGWQQIGLVSWGESCAQPNFYGVYTRLSSYQDFISQYVCNSESGTSLSQLNVCTDNTTIFQNTHLTNISTRAPILGGANNVIVGFILEGTGTQQIVLRGWGLETRVDPMLILQKQLSDGNWQIVAGNNNWQKGARYPEIPSQMTSSFEANDAALFLELAAGVYTVNLSSVGQTGRGLVGVDAIDSNQNIKLINLSTRAPIKGGADNIVAGFIITGGGTQKILLRGWGLDAGVDPVLRLQKQLSSGTWNVIANNDDWQTDSRHAEIPNYMTANFKSNDAALLRDLQAGVYTVTLSSGDANGLGLVGVDALN
jgi:secreted trypsin-like serine protease